LERKGAQMNKTPLPKGFLIHYTIPFKKAGNFSPEERILSRFPFKDLNSTSSL
jgi:hypothetical protein